MKSYYWKISSNNPFHATDLFSLKKSEIQRFSSVFRWYSKRPAGWNGLIRLAHYTLRCSRKYQTFSLTFYAKLALELDQDLFSLRNLIVLLSNLDLKLYNWPPRQKREALKTNNNFSGWISKVDVGFTVRGGNKFFEWYGKASAFIFIFWTAAWLPYSQLCPSRGGNFTNLILITVVESWFDPKVTGSLVKRLDPKACPSA